MRMPSPKGSLFLSETMFGKGQLESHGSQNVLSRKKRRQFRPYFLRFTLLQTSLPEIIIKNNNNKLAPLKS